LPNLARYRDAVLSTRRLTRRRIKPVPDQLGRAEGVGDYGQVLKRVAQLVVQVIPTPTVLARPATVQLLDRTEEPGHLAIVAVGTGAT
jgi:hypothetical protein